VFNRKGQVIGLFTYGTARESVTYAIPIRYARDLLQMQQH
jgi:S1-C subfamily serine protease